MSLESVVNEFQRELRDGALRNRLTDYETIRQLRRELAEAREENAQLREEIRQARSVADKLEALAAEDTADIFAVAGAILSAQKGLA